MQNPFRPFTLASTGATVYIDISTVDSFYRYLNPNKEEGEEVCTIINTSSDATWAVEEMPDEVLESISIFIESEKLGYTI
jgi:hypothetical protein